MNRLVALAAALAITLASLVQPRPAPAQQLPAANLELLDQLGGAMSRPIVVGSYAHVAVGSRYHVLDVSDPGQPRLVAESRTGPLPGQFVVRGRYVYVAAGSAGLRIYDAVDPTRLVEVAAVPFAGSAGWVALDGNRAYVSGSGLHVVDVSDPTRPTVLGGHLQAGSGPIAVAGNFVFEAGGYHVFGYSVEVWYVAYPSDITQVGFYPRSDYASFSAVELVGTHLYLAELPNNYPSGTGGLRVLDVSEPTRPRDVAFVDTPGRPNDLRVVDGYAYMTEDSQSGGRGGLRVVDARDPARPALVGAALDGREVTAVTPIGGGRVLLNEASDGLRVVDASTPTAPSEVGAYTTLGIVSSLVLDAGRAYVSQRSVATGDPRTPGSTIAIVDVSDPSNLRQLGAYQGRGGTFAARGGYLYVGEAPDRFGGQLRSAGGIRVVDARDAARPAEVGFIPFPGDYESATTPLNLAIVGGYLYVLEGDAPARTGGIRVYGLADPASPSLWSTITTSITSGQLAIGDGFVVVGDGRVFSTADPALPAETSRIPADNFFTSIGVAAGRRLYVVHGRHFGHNVAQTHVEVFDMADPRQPRSLGTYPEPGRTVAATGDLLFASTSAGLRAWANLACPTVVASYPLGPVFAGGAAVEGDRLFVAAQEAGFHALRLTGQSGQCHRVFMPILGHGPAAG